MATALETSQRSLRLSWVTWLASSAVIAAFIWCDFFGSFDVNYHWYAERCYGWPFLAAVRTSGGDGHNYSFAWLAIAADGIAAIALASMAAFVTEKCKRKLSHGLQFGIKDLLLFMSVLCIMLFLGMSEPDLPWEFSSPNRELRGLQYGTTMRFQSLPVRISMYYAIACSVWAALTCSFHVLNRVRAAVFARSMPQD
jgi:hypothetical protein